MPQGFATHGKLPFVFLVIDWNWSFYSILRVFLEQGWFQLIWLLVLHTQSPPWLTHCIMDSQHLPLFFRMPSAFVARVHSWVSIISKLTSNEWCFAVRQHALLVLLEEFFLSLTDTLNTDFAHPIYIVKMIASWSHWPMDRFTIAIYWGGVWFEALKKRGKIFNWTNNVTHSSRGQIQANLWCLEQE